MLEHRHRVSFEIPWEMKIELDKLPHGAKRLLFTGLLRMILKAVKGDGPEIIAKILSDEIKETEISGLFEEIKEETESVSD